MYINSRWSLMNPANYGFSIGAFKLDLGALGRSLFKSAKSDPVTNIAPEVVISAGSETTTPSDSAVMPIHSVVPIKIETGAANSLTTAADAGRQLKGIIKALDEQKEKNNDLITKLLDKGSTVHAAASFVRQAGNYVRLVLSQPKAFNELRVSILFSVPKAVKGLSASAESFRKGGNKLTILAGLPENFRTVVDVPRSAMSILNTFGLLTAQAAVAITPLSVVVESINLCCIGSQLNTAVKTNKLYHSIIGKPISEMVTQFSKSSKHEDKVIEKVFGLKKSVLCEAFQYIEKNCSPKTQVRFKNSLEERATKDLWSQRLTILISVVKFALALISIFTPFGSIVCVLAVAGLALIAFAKIAMKQQTDLEKQQLHLDIRSYLEKSDKVGRLLLATSQQ